MNCQTNPLVFSYPPPTTATTDTAVSPRRHSCIAIDIPTIPAPYVPGTGPVSRDATIIPVHDSTAYIIDRMFLPEGAAADGELRPKSLAWLIGFRDRPAARIAVRAHQVLDYVSPRELEDYEYRQWLRRQEQMVHDAAQNNHAGGPQATAQQGKKHKSSVDLQLSERPHVKTARARRPKKKPGSRVLVEPQIETAPGPLSDVPLDATLPATMSPVKTSGPSLSPKKRKFVHLDPISQSEMSEDDSVHKQMPRDFITHRHTSVHLDSTNDQGFELVNSDLIRKRPEKSPLPPMPQKPMTSTTPTIQIPKPMGTTKRLFPTAVPKAAPTKQTSTTRDKLTIEKSLSIRDSSTTQKSPAVRGGSTIKKSPVKKPTIATQQTPNTQPTAVVQPKETVTKSPLRTVSFTPIQARISGWASINKPREIQPSIPPVRQDPVEIIDSNEEDEDDKHHAEQNDANNKEHDDTQGDAIEDLEDDEYIVESIKDVKSKSGKLLFLVCWAGDWPPDQKHTWEPYENINSVMTADYLAANPVKAQAMQASKLIASFYKRERQRNQKIEKKKHTGLDTVMSAFAGEDEWLEDNVPLLPSRDEQDTAVDEGEVLLVTENGKEPNGVPFEFRWD